MSSGNGPIKPNQWDYGRVGTTAHNNYLDDPTPTGFENRRSTQPRSVSQVPHQQSRTSSNEYGISQVMKEVGRQMRDDSYGLKANKAIARFGLANMEGQLNCFLNSALQSLWNLSPVSFSLKYYCQDPISEAEGGEINEN